MPPAPVVRDEGAEQSVDAARRAHADDAEVPERIGRGPADDPGGEEDQQEAERSELALLDVAEQVEPVGVQPDVQDAGVQEHRGADPPPLAGRDPDDVSVRQLAESDRRPEIDQPERPGTRDEVGAAPRDDLDDVAATISPSRTDVAETRRTEATAARRPGPRRNSRFASATQSGQWCPTGAGIMQSGQMGLPQRVQWTPVSRSGCR